MVNAKTTIYCVRFKILTYYSRLRKKIQLLKYTIKKIFFVYFEYKRKNDIQKRIIVKKSAGIFCNHKI